jgi:hypothetical protein
VYSTFEEQKQVLEHGDLEGALNTYILQTRFDRISHPRSLIRINAVRLPTLLQVEKLIANSTDPVQTARMRRLVWIHAGRKSIMLILS